MIQAEMNLPRVRHLEHLSRIRSGLRIFRRAAAAGLVIVGLVGCIASEDLEVDRSELDPLLEAGDRAAVEKLLNRGMDPVFALVRAARVGAEDMVVYLLEYGADPNGALDDGFGSTALMAGASGNHPEVVPILVAAGADVDQTDVVGDPALNWAAYMGQVEYAQALLEAGARSDIRSVHGNAFEIALRQGWAPLIEMLGAPAGEGLAPHGQALLTAILAGKAQATDKALEAGASPDLRTGAGIPVLAVAAEAGHVDVVVSLLGAGAAVDAADPIGFTPLFYAARSGHSDLVRRLAKAGAKIDRMAKPGGMGMTPLHMAGVKGQVEAVRALLELGAGPDAVNIRGESALAWSITEGHPEAALVFLEAGADPDLSGESDYSARQAARDYGYEAVLEAMGEPADENPK